MLETVKVDSLKIRVPRHKVEYIDPTFAQEYQKVFITTGELENHVNLDKHKVNIENGITTRIAVFHCLTGQFAEEQIIIQCNAKQLKEKYFQGINNETIIDLYNYIISLKIIYLSIDTFLNAYVSDIDFCYDVNVSVKSMIEANAEIHRKINPSCYRYVSKPFRREKENVGIQFNTREKATPAKPYVKIYHKTLELETQSSLFSQTYLKNQNFKNIGRLEFTLKNAKHKKYLDLQFQSLKDLLDLNQDVLEKIIFSGIMKYIERKIILREFKDLSPTDRLLLHFMNRTINKGDDKEMLYASLNIFDNPQERSRMKKKLIQLIENVDDKDRLVANRETLNFLRVLKLNFE